MRRHAQGTTLGAAAGVVGLATGRLLTGCGGGGGGNSRQAGTTSAAAAAPTSSGPSPPTGTGSRPRPAPAHADRRPGEDRQGKDGNQLLVELRGLHVTASSCDWTTPSPTPPRRACSPRTCCVLATSVPRVRLSGPSHTVRVKRSLCVPVDAARRRPGLGCLDWPIASFDSPLNVSCNVDGGSSGSQLRLWTRPWCRAATRFPPVSNRGHVLRRTKSAHDPDTPSLRTE